MNDTTVAGVPQGDGAVRAAWVDASTNPKKHGAFEGYLKGEPHKVSEYFWTGRRWFYKNRLGKWIPSVFGEKGDKWRGLCDSVDTPLTVVGGEVVFPENPVIGAMYHTETGASWLCNGKRWLCKRDKLSPQSVEAIFCEEEAKALQAIAKEAVGRRAAAAAAAAAAASPEMAVVARELKAAVREEGEKTSIAKAGAMRRTRSAFVSTGEDIHHDIAGVEASYRNTKDSE